MGSSSEGLLEKGPFEKGKAQTSSKHHFSDATLVFPRKFFVLLVEDGNIRNMPTKTVREKDFTGSFKRNSSDQTAG